MQREKILIVDDSEMNRSILTDMLGEEYEILEAEDGVQALARLQEERNISLVLLDMVMPRMDGFKVLEYMNQTGRIQEVPVIMISAESGSQQVAKAYDMGVSDFIPRPFDALIVRRRVVNTLLLYAKQKRLSAMVEEQIYETERRSSMMIEVLSRVVEFRNGESGMHVLNVRLVTELLLRALTQRTDRYNLSSADIARISIGSALHDIGKIVIDEKLLNKPGKLTPEEFEIMKTHALQGAEILDAIPIYRSDPLIRTAYEICRWHHERYDGRGYPDGLQGDAIPISAQVVSMADVYDALISKRAYKEPIPHETAVAMIADGQCGAFNPLLLQCLTENSEQMRRELAEGTARSVTRREIRNIVDESIYTYHGGASDRTLRLLDYERTKYNFFSAMTHEIQFEYTFAPPMLNLAAWGAEMLGIDEITMDPARDRKIRSVLGVENWNMLRNKIKQTTPETPMCSYECLLTYGGKTRWHEVHLRSIWSEDVPPKLESVLGKAIDIHDTREKMEELEERAARDPMTGLLNRSAAQEKIVERLKDRTEDGGALALIDLDFFKVANDNHGHEFGDEVLKEVARRLRHSVRGTDIVCRAGGDEFMLFLECELEVESCARRIFRSLCGPFHDFEISATIGIAPVKGDNRTYESLFRTADAALYAAKREGRRRYRVYDESMDDVLATKNDN